MFIKRKMLSETRVCHPKTTVSSEWIIRITAWMPVILSNGLKKRKNPKRLFIRENYAVINIQFETINIKC